MKRYIFTENQIKKVIDNVVVEQTMANDQKVAIDAGTKAFLDLKKIQGTDLTSRIMTYQKSVGQESTGHILDTKLPEADKAMWQKLVNKNKPLFDKAMDVLNRWIGIVPSSGY
jgi:hypothetical protein